MVWIYLSIIILMRVVQSVFSKKNSNNLHKNAVCYVKYTIYYQAIASIFALGLYFVELFSNPTMVAFGQTFFYASICGVALACACFCGIYVLTNGTMVLSSLFGTAGLIIPAVASIFLYDEQILWYQWIALVVFMIGATFLSLGSKKVYGKFSLKQLLILIFSLIVNGLAMLMQKMFGEEVKGASVSLFSFLTFFIGLILLSIFLLVLSLCKKNATTKQNDKDFSLYPPCEEQAKFPKKSYLYGLFLAVAVFLINQLVTLSTPMIQAVVLFSIACGGATVISAIVGAVMYKEKLTPLTLIGLVLGIGSLILLKV